MKWDDLQNLRVGDMIVWGLTSDHPGECDIVICAASEINENHIEFKIWDSIDGAPRGVRFYNDAHDQHIISSLRHYPLEPAK